MDFAESRMDDAQTPPDAEVMHSSAQRDGGTTLSMHFHNPWCGGALTGVWELTHGEGFHTRTAVSLMTLVLLLGPFHICWTRCFKMNIKMGFLAYFPTKFALSLGQNVKGKIWHN